MTDLDIGHHLMLFLMFALGFWFGILGAELISLEKAAKSLKPASAMLLLGIVIGLFHRGLVVAKKSGQETEGEPEGSSQGEQDRVAIGEPKDG